MPILTACDVSIAGTFGDMKSLKDLRDELELSQLEFCRRAKIGYSTYAKVEAGNRNASRDIVRKLAKFYTKSPETIKQAAKITRKRAMDKKRRARAKNVEL